MTSPSDLYEQIQDSIYERIDDDFDSLSKAEKTFFFVDWLEMQVHNGGWHQWYNNFPDADRVSRITESIEALQAIGAQKTITLLRDAVRHLAAGVTPGDRRLVALNESLWEHPDDLEKLALKWAEDRIDEFAI